MASENPIIDFLSSFLKRETKALVSSGVRGIVKKSAKNLYKNATAKTQEAINAEIAKDIGYLTTHYKLDKEQNILYKPSVVFFHEWLTNSPTFANRIVKDEETGKLYLDQHPFNNSTKIDIINSFIKQTKVQSAGLHSHLEGAIKLLTCEDYNSILFKNYFSGWSKEQPSVIDTWLTSLYGQALNDPEYANLLFKKWIVGVARRAINPGSPLDGCLTLQGPTGVGKTSHFRNLLPEPFNNRTGEVYCDIRNPQKFVEATIGKTVCCFDELSILEHSKVLETFKQLLTSSWVDVRLAWRRDPARFNLRTGFGATTNKDKFITDATLSRRLWVVSLNDKNRINFDFLFSNRKMLWMEALYLAQQNYSCHLSQQEQKTVEEYNQKYLI